MKTIPRIAIDIDGVLADFTSSMADVYRAMGIDLPLAYKPTDWYWTTANLPPNAMKRAWDRIDNTENFWMTVTPLPDIVSLATFYHEYADRQCEIYFITARLNGKGKPVRLQSEEWLREYMGDPRQHINVITVRNGMDKAAVIRSMQIKYSIDDNVPTVVNNKSIHGHQAYLRSQPWNRDGEYYNLNIVYSLDEFLTEVKHNW